MTTTGKRYKAFKQAVRQAGLALYLLPWAFPLASQNLVPNPGFEESDSCTFGLGLGQIHDWYSAFLTPDHLQSCQPYGTANGLPMNLFTFQHPYEGSSCVGVFTYVDLSGQEQREWIMVSLLETLVPGETYYCSFRANAGFGGNDEYPQIWVASDHVGMLFSTYDRHWYSGDPYPAPLNLAQIQYPQVLTDTLGWTLVSGSFVADSAYTFLMIGNFFTNSLTDTLHFGDQNAVWPWYDFGYTLIDAVCVSISPNGCELENGIALEGNALPYVYPNPATDVLIIGNANGQNARMLDMLGRTLWNGRVEGERIAIGVASWARGSYVLKLEGSRGKRVVKFVLTE